MAQKKAIPFLQDIRLSFAFRAEDAFNFVSDDVMDELTAVGEVLARVEMFRVLCHVLTDAGSQAETEVGVDIDLADSALGRFAELLLGDAYCIGHLAAVFVDYLNEFLRHRGRTMKHDGEAGQTLCHFVQYIEAEWRRYQYALFVAGTLGGGELVCAVAGADGDGQRVYAGAVDEFLDLVRAGIGGILGGYLYLVLNACKGAELALYHYAVIMGILDYLTGQGDVVLEGFGGTVYHDGGKAAVYAALAQLEGIAVVEMHHYGKIKARGLLRVLYSGLDELHQVYVLGVGACALGDLKDKRSALFDSGLGDALNDLHIVHVEGANGIAACIRFCKHFLRSYNRH